MGQQTRNPELDDLERQEVSSKLDGLAMQAIEGINQATQAFTGIEQTATQLKLDSELSSVLAELRISSVKASAMLRDLLGVAAVAKVLAKISEKEQE